VLNLTVLQPSNTSQNIQLCYGQSLTIGNDTYNQSGVYQNFLINTNGCDSIVTTILFVDTLQAEININGQFIAALNYPTNATFQWLDCNNNFTPIFGETNSLLTPIIDGNYAVIVSNSGCSDTSSCLNYTTVGISTLENNFTVNIYPNPTNEALIIEFSYLQENISYKLMDNIGRQLDSGSLVNQKTTLSLIGLSSGIYYLQLLNNLGQQKIIKVMKE